MGKRVDCAANAFHIEDASKSFDIFVVNEQIFKSKDELFVCKYDPSEYKLDEIKEQSQIKLNSLNINDTMSISQWNQKDGTGGCVQIYCSKTLTIGKNGRISAHGSGYSRGFGFGQATKKRSGGGYGTKGKGEGGGQ